VKHTRHINALWALLIVQTGGTYSYQWTLMGQVTKESVIRKWQAWIRLEATCRAFIGSFTSTFAFRLYYRSRNDVARDMASEPVRLCKEHVVTTSVCWIVSQAKKVARGWLLIINLAGLPCSHRSNSQIVGSNPVQDTYIALSPSYSTSRVSFSFDVFNT
jgi:hypothetical protein